MDLKTLEQPEKVNFKPDDSEAKVREAFLMPIIEFLGYKDEYDDIIRESEFRIKVPFFKLGTKKISLTKLQADFILGLKGTKDIVIDAKSPGFDIENLEFLMQAYSYASHIEVNAKYFLISNGTKTNVYYTHDIKIEPILSIQQDEVIKKALLLSDLLSRKSIRKKNQLNHYDYEVEREKINFLDLFFQESKDMKYPISPELYGRTINMKPELATKLYHYLQENETNFKTQFSETPKFQSYFDFHLSELLKNFLEHERIGIALFAFKSENRGIKYLNVFKDTIKADKYLIIKTQWMFYQLPMPFLFVVFCDGWEYDHDDESYSLLGLEDFFKLLRRDGLSFSYDYETTFYDPSSVKIFITEKMFMEFLDPEITYDTEDSAYLLDMIRFMFSKNSPDEDDRFISVSVSGERINIYRSYDPEDYSFWYLIKKIRNNEELDGFEREWLELIFDVDDYQFDDFINSVTNARRLIDIPFQNESTIKGIKDYESKIISEFKSQRSS